MLMWKRYLLLSKPDHHLVFNALIFQVTTGIALIKERRSGGGAVTILGVCEPTPRKLSSVQERHQQTGMSPMEGDQDG